LVAYGGNSHDTTNSRMDRSKNIFVGKEKAGLLVRVSHEAVRK